METISVLDAPDLPNQTAPADMESSEKKALVLESIDEPQTDILTLHHAEAAKEDSEQSGVVTDSSVHGADHSSSFATPSEEHVVISNDIQPKKEAKDILPDRRRRNAPVEPLSFQEAYELSRDNSFVKPDTGSLKKAVNHMIFMNTTDWRKNRDVVDGKISKWSDRAMFFGLSGAMCAVVQNELTFQNVQHSHMVMDLLKLVNLFCTILCATCIFRICKLKVLFDRVSKHMTRGWPLDLQVQFSSVVTETVFLLEMLVVFPHLPPGCTFEFGAKNMGNFVLYRGEMIACLWNTLRTYLLWRVIKHRVLDQYPKRHTVQPVHTCVAVHCLTAALAPCRWARTRRRPCSHRSP